MCCPAGPRAAAVAAGCRTEVEAIVREVLRSRYLTRQRRSVAAVCREALGARKRQENLRWLVKFARDQRHRLGRVYLEFGEPLPLRERLAELRADETAAPYAVERVALDVCNRINRVTPVTAIVSLALLGADRALTLSQVLDTVGPLASYIAGRSWPVAGAANLTDRSTIRRALQELVASGVLTSYDGGTETVWRVAPERHLVAAFYRNTAIHILVDRAISELALLAVEESTEDPWGAVRDEALRLRELLKFDFFFSGRNEFGDELNAELALFDPLGETPDPRSWLRHARPLVAHLVLRPFLDAYHVVADRLAGWDDDEFDEQRFLSECLSVGQQWVLQRRVASAESVSLELYRTALRLARYRGLVESAEPQLAKRRRVFLDQVRDVARRATLLADLARTAQHAR